jgi:N6-adenosine-specific RNA methylase IME4
MFYHTMRTPQIAAMAIQDIAADDAALFAWSTVAHVPECLKVIEAWGFEYKSQLV